MRFCMITTFYPPYNFGGDGRFVQRLAHALARRGHEVEVVHCTDAYRILARREPAPAPPEPAGVTVHRLRSRLGPLSPLATQQTGRPGLKAPALSRILARGFDVINYHNISLIGGAGLLELGDAIKLYTFHDYWLVCPTHVLFRDRRAACREPHCLRCQLIYRRPPQLWRHGGALRRALAHVDRFIAASRATAAEHSRLGLDLPVAYLPHFVPRLDGEREPERAPGVGTASGLAEAARHVDPAARQADDYFLFVGRLEWLKGVQTLLPLFARRPDLRLRIVGEGPAEQRLQRLAAACANVEFLGRRDGAHLARLYRSARALLVPSLSPEVSPLVVLEALSLGTPVIARAIGSLNELVAERGAGLTFETLAECEAALDRLQADPGYRAALSERGREVWRREHTEEVYLQRYLALIADLVRARAGR